MIWKCLLSIENGLLDESSADDPRLLFTKFYENDRDELEGVSCSCRTQLSRKSARLVSVAMVSLMKNYVLCERYFYSTQNILIYLSKKWPAFLACSKQCIKLVAISLCFFLFIMGNLSTSRLYSTAIWYIRFVFVRKYEGVIKLRRAEYVDAKRIELLHIFTDLYKIRPSVCRIFSS